MSCFVSGCFCVSFMLLVLPSKGAGVAEFVYTHYVVGQPAVGQQQSAAHMSVAKVINIDQADLN